MLGRPTGDAGSRPAPGAQNRMRPDIDPMSKGYIRWGSRQGRCGRHLRLAHSTGTICDAALSLYSRLSLPDTRLTRVCSAPARVGYKRYYQPGKRDFASAPSDRFFKPLRPKGGRNSRGGSRLYEECVRNCRSRSARRGGACEADGRTTQIHRQTANDLRRGVVRPCERTDIAYAYLFSQRRARIGASRKPALFGRYFTTAPDGIRSSATTRGRCRRGLSRCWASTPTARASRTTR